MMKGLAVLLVGLLVAKPASAQDDTREPAPRPDLPGTADVYPYAGLGGTKTYAERGVAEFGGSASFSTGPEFLSFSAEPMIGYFPWDNIQVSGIVGARILTVDGDTRAQYSMIVEPSVHLPITETVFGFGGLGAGLGLAPSPDETLLGVMLAPRLGAQLLVGRSGLLNLAARYGMTFAEVEPDLEPLEGRAVVAFVNIFDIQAGYTIMF